MGAPSGWALSVPGRCSPAMWWPIHQNNFFRRPKGPKQALKALFFCLAPKMKEATSNQVAFLVSDK